MMAAGSRFTQFARWAVALLAAMVGLHLITAWNARNLVARGYPDFTIFYSAGKMIRKGWGSRLYEEQAQYRTQLEFAAGVGIRQGPLPYNHPPFEALIFVPFSYLPYLPAFLLWDAINIAVLASLPYLLRPHLPALEKTSILTWLFVSLAFFPVFIALLQGQDILILLLLFTLAFVSLKKNSELVSGCWLGLGLFRFHLVLPIVLILAIRRRYRVVLGFAMMALALGFISMAAVGVHETFAYPHYVLSVERSMAVRRTVIPIDMPNFRGLVDLFFPISARILPAMLVGAASAVLLITAIRKWKLADRGPGAFDLGFALCIVVSILISYHAFFYDLSLLILPLAFVVNDWLSSDERNGDALPTTAWALPLLFFAPLWMLLFKYNAACLMAVVLMFWAWAISKRISRLRSLLVPAAQN